MEITRPVTEPARLADVALDDRLAAEARTNVQAFARLYERHVQRVFRYLRARGADEDAAAELTSMTFERALRHIGRYRAGGPGFAPWLLRIARNASIDAIRRRRDRPIDPGDLASLVDAALSPEDAAIAAEERAMVRRLVAALPEVQRDALALRYAGGLSSREIGAVIGKTEAATKKLITRSLVILKEAYRHDS